MIKHCSLCTLFLLSTMLSACSQQGENPLIGVWCDKSIQGMYFEREFRENGVCRGFYIEDGVRRESNYRMYEFDEGRKLLTVYYYHASSEPEQSLGSAKTSTIIKLNPKEMHERYLEGSTRRVDKWVRK